MKYRWAIANLGLLVCGASGCSGASGALTSAGGSTGVATTGGNSSGTVGGTTSAPGGGQSAVGGTTAAGTTASAGGTTATGSSPATGGNSSVGGTTNAGGSSTGGSLPAGGSASSGGKSSTGGSAPTGGKSSAGGSAPTGGSASTGGKSNTGGTTATGGSAVTGGNSSAGGTSSTGGSSSTSTSGCTRESLGKHVNDYLEAAKAKNSALMSLADPVKYVENWASSTMGQGIWQTALKIDFSRSIFDVDTCETFTEVIVTDSTHPYVIGTRLTVKNDKISEMNSLVTDAGDWLFDAAAYLKNSQPEDWGVLPADHRVDRQTLIDAGSAYWDYFDNANAPVPWGTPCIRLEGGPYTSYGATATCNVGITPPSTPSSFSTFRERHFVVDVELGSVDGMALMGNLPDSHLFRVVSGKLRFIHTLTVCYDASGKDLCANLR